jgi:predicted nucleotidyltransferase
MKTADSALLREITERLASEFDPEGIVLFGSHAWGEPNEDSDLDLLVIVSDSDERPARRARRAYRCLRGVKAPLDVLVRTRGEVDRHRNVRASLVSRALDDGIVLYGRSDALART